MGTLWQFILQLQYTLLCDLLIAVPGPGRRYNIHSPLEMHVPSQLEPLELFRLQVLYVGTSFIWYCRVTQLEIRAVQSQQKT